MDIQSLTDAFAISGVLSFEKTDTGLIRARISMESCTAEIYLQGAHLTHWQPNGHDPVLFLSERSFFATGKPIRGGVPVVFPWFGHRAATPEDPRTDGPQHGFARTSVWQLAFAAISGEDLHLTFTLGPSEESRALGYDHFQLAYQVIVGRELRLSLTVANDAGKPLRFEEAFHTYLSVGDAQQIQISGLSDTEYLDKTDNLARKRQIEAPLKLTGETDRPYLNTTTTVDLTDPLAQRRISVSKANSKTTVVWNPWIDLCAKLADMPPEAWRRMTCIETANAAEDAITLAPGDTHSMSAHIVVEEFAQ